VSSIATTTDRIAPARPRMRGWLHQVGFVITCLAGAALVAAADSRRLLAGAVFAASAGLSALNHRTSWSPKV